MKGILYWRLAVDGIRKNKKLYIPYLLTCIGMVTMAYIVQSLSYTPTLLDMRGRGNIEMVLTLGKFVMLVFSVFFLLYSNSFLIRRRYREFGLYNVLGMGKRALASVILWESGISAFIGLFFGIAFGILFSKLAELGLVNAIHKTADYSFVISWESIEVILQPFVVIFGILTVKSLIQVYRTKPLELLKSENAGEKPPKANYLLALLGLGLLFGAYYMAVTIESPLKAMLLFFVAVVMVIVATYFICISGSVTLCRFLQKRKRYYYHKNHFVSVGTMVYRMKRNGAGLASICILCTMILVMLTSTSGLYFGAEDTLRNLYPYDIGIAIHTPDLDRMKAEHVEIVRETFESVFEEEAAVPSEIFQYPYATISGLLTEEHLEADSSLLQRDEAFAALTNIRSLFFFRVEDYNRCMGAELSLEQGQAMVYGLRCQFDQDVFTLGDLKLDVVGQLEDFMPIGEANSAAFPSILFVISDLEELRPLEPLRDIYNGKMLNLRLFFGCNMRGFSDEKIIKINEHLKDSISSMDFLNDGKGFGWIDRCRVQEREEFYTLFGGLFFLGIILSIMFLCAAALIIYYKQISEGYEDQSRFAIMRKVGMTQEDIRKNINAQVLIVFFIPLILAGVHLSFAFPIVWKLLQLFNLRNLPLVLIVNVVVFLIFCVFYGIIYKLTAGAYYAIVSGGKKR